MISSGCRKGSANRVQRNVEIISGCRCFSETTRRRMTHAHRTMLMIKNGKARFVYAHRLLQGRFCKHSSRAEIRILYARYALSIKKGGASCAPLFFGYDSIFPAPCTVGCKIVPDVYSSACPKTNRASSRANSTTG